MLQHMRRNLVVLDGRPAIGYHNEADQAVRLYVAVNPLGSQWN
eukprot:NODE_12585_length_380_cov_2.184290_g11436_i0.p5 GENE.NODE_12585_length_380_cov_2.184290_g11436_i0~~NODE_12585_length_380_cov_2.184290_g11436_i0.p5  ORF type:complete len:51 (-),score=10.58 NODE_12585_length_380_cov_2.184290_g11436_i0:226-354(-)